METCSRLKFFVFRCLLLAVVCRCDNSVPYCPVVSVNTTFSMTCPVQDVDNSWFIIWEVTDLTSGQSTEITRCAMDQKVCDTNQKTARFSVINSPEGAMTYSSNLTLVNVQIEDRNLQLTCKSWRSGSVKAVSRCRMAVYKKGDSTVCSNTVLDDGGIQLLCTNRFTTISCQYIESINSEFRPIQNLRSKNGSLSGYLGECRQVVYPLGPGTYKYDFLIQVDLGNGEIREHLPGTQLVLQPKPKVTVLQSPNKVPLCNNKPLAIVGCQVTWVKVQPTFHFYLHGTEIENMVVREIKYRNETNSYSMFEAVSEVTVTELDNRSLMLCVVSFRSGEEEISLNDTKHLSLTWPPREPPVFLSDSGSMGLFKLGNQLKIKKGENTTLVCRALGGQPQVNRMEITCRQKDSESSNRSESNFVSLTVIGNARFNNSLCQCVMHHESNCYTSTAVIQLVVTPLGRQVYIKTSKKPDKMVPIYYIIAGVLVLLLFPFVVAACCMVCRRLKYDDDYYYGYNDYGYSGGDRSYINMLRHVFTPPRPTPPGLTPPPIPPRPSNEPQPPPIPAPRIPPRPGNTLSRADAPPDSGDDDLDSGLWEDDDTLTVAIHGRQKRITYDKKRNRRKNSEKTQNLGAAYSHYIAMHPPKSKYPDTVVEPLSLSNEVSGSKATSSSETFCANISESDRLLPRAIKQQTPSHQPSPTDVRSVISLGFEPPGIHQSPPKTYLPDIAVCAGAGARSSVSSDHSSSSSGDDASITEVDD
ncbi:hypothetical protein Btru_040838 [Bulinus truncatus]|nr:hypothetical protein Btru_040838 [Bulinus truncatus]